jgi:flagellar motor protein MotB
VQSSAFADNAALSLARANSVRDILVSYTLDPGAISVDGAGATLPLVAPETDDAAKAVNRRTEILVSEAGTEVDPALLSPGDGLEVRP